MAKIKILYVSSEINPFLKSSEVADYVRKLPQSMQERGMEGWSATIILALIGSIGKTFTFYCSL